jgi:hypothetical protein
MAPDESISGTSPFTVGDEVPLRSGEVSSGNPAGISDRVCQAEECFGPIVKTEIMSGSYSILS